MINPVMYRLNETWAPSEHGNLPLHRAFFAPFRIVYEGGIDPLIRGLIAKPMKARDSDSSMSAELIERLFAMAESVALDLGALNVQRGRDHALPFYNEWRQYCNLSNARTFDDLAREIRNPNVRAKLEEQYKTPQNIDAFVGMILEDIVDGSRLGPTLGCLLSEQFKRTRDGDRFWYENPGIFSPEQLTSLKQTSLARIICDNTDTIKQVPKDVFLNQPVPDFVSCSHVPTVDLSAWVDCRENCLDPDSTGTVSGFLSENSRQRRDSGVHSPEKRKKTAKDKHHHKKHKKHDKSESSEEHTTAEFETLQTNNDDKSDNLAESKEDHMAGLFSVLRSIQQQLDTLQSEVSTLKSKIDDEN